MASATLLIERDVLAIEKACTEEKNCPFKDFKLSDSALTFTFITPKGKPEPVHYIINFCDDYPDNTLISCSDQTMGPSKIVHRRLPLLFEDLTKEHYKAIFVPMPPLKLPIDRTISGDSHYSDCVSDMDEDDNDYDYYYGEEMEQSGTDSEMHSLLSHELDEVRHLFGETSVNYRLLGFIDDIDIEFNMDMTFLDEEIAKAWRVQRDEPIVIRLHMSVTKYLDGTVPKVEVFQPSKKEKFGLGSQLRKIFENFVQTRWKDLSNESVQKQLRNPVPSAIENSLSPQKKKKTKDSGAKSSKDDLALHDQAMTKMQEMGFSAAAAKSALVMCRWKVEDAINLMVNSGPVDSLNEDISLPLAKRQQSFPGTQQASRGMANLKMLQPETSTTPGDDLTLLPTSTESGKNAKQIPGLESGFLVQCMRYARQRIPTLNEYCVICDNPHVFQNGAMLKPAVCSRELCVFAFQTIGVMSDAAEDIATGAEVVDLLVAMARAALRSTRKNIIFEPYPTIVDPRNSTELALGPKKKDLSRVERLIESFPSTYDMTRLLGPKLKVEMDKRDILGYPLLQWIISSNRSHIVKLPQEKQISFMHTPHQFLLWSSPPAKEAIFRAAREKSRSTFAFHGSHIDNWHSIMRNGLLNASGTKHQMHGAAYGNGIYLSPHASVSFNYSGMGHGSYKPNMKSKAVNGTQAASRFLKSKNLTCIALCEVITNGDLKQHGNVWVAVNPDHVCTRFFFVYEEGQIGDSSIDTQLQKYKTEIAKAVSYHRSC